MSVILCYHFRVTQGPKLYEFTPIARICSRPTTAAWSLSAPSPSSPHRPRPPQAGGGRDCAQRRDGRVHGVYWEKT